jgi:hypothetical protein
MCNLQQMARFFSKLVSFLLPVTNALVLANNLAYRRICLLEIRIMLDSVFSIANHERISFNKQSSLP